MKNSNSFRFKFNALTWALLVLVFLICLAGGGFNIYNLAISKGALAINIVSLIIILIINLFLASFVLSVMCFSKYVAKNQRLYTYFGFIRLKINAERITQLTHFKKSDKLVAYLDDEKYTVIVISADKYDAFVKAVRELNAKIIFDAQENLD